MKQIRLVASHDLMAAYNWFVDKDEAYRFLRRSAWEFDNHKHFRNVWLQTLGAPGSRSPGDEKVFRDLAYQLSSGRLCIAESKPVTRSTGPSGIRGMTSHSGAGISAPPQEIRRDTHMVERISPSMLRPAPTGPREETDTTVAPEPIADVAQQIAVVIQAAKDGTPFCEQCELNRK